MKNKFMLSEDGEYYKIFFTNGEHFMIDAIDFEKVSKYTWFCGKRGYPITHTSRKSPDGHKTITLHRYILNPELGFDIDHISGNKMDNRHANLRICSHQQNMFNQKLRNTNTTGYYGVRKSSKTDKYEAYIHYNGKKKYIGTYISPEEAAIARDSVASVLFGEYARMNQKAGGLL